MPPTLELTSPAYVLDRPVARAKTVAEAKADGFHIPSLDGIRAASFALVFAGHAGLNHIVPAGFGVTVFFFLSGYLITTLLRLEEQKTGTVSLSNFYLRRVLRILPPFYLVFGLALLAWATGLLPGPTESGSIASVIFHYANYFMVAHGHDGFLEGTGVYWSLAVEEHFYLVFPLVFLGLARTKLSHAARAAALLAICGVILLWRVALVYGDYEAFLRETGTTGGFLRTSVGSDARFDSLLFGCALAVFGNPALDRTALSDRVWKFGLLPLGLLGLLLSFAIRDDEFRATARYTIQGMSLIPLFVCAIRYSDWMPMRLLNVRPIAFVGVLSYSLYLSHLMILGIVSRHLTALNVVAQSILALAVSIGFSWLLFVTVEKPIARLRRRLRT